MTRPAAQPALRRGHIPTVLMTVDEARVHFGRSALACLQSASCGPGDLWAMLAGLPVRGLGLSDRRLAAAHRWVLADIEAAGHGDVVDVGLEADLHEPHAQFPAAPAAFTHTTSPRQKKPTSIVPVRGGRATVPPGCWEEDRAPVVGELVLVADSGAGPFEATVTGVEADGTFVLVVHAFVPAHA